jgi:hypothetical protein
MKYRVILKKKALKGVSKLPKKANQKFSLLLDWLGENGPVAHLFSNYSKLGKNKHHCHLDYSWVACWTQEGDELKIEVYYVGSRENAPY